MRSALSLVAFAIATIAACAVPNLDEPPLPGDGDAATAGSAKAPAKGQAPSTGGTAEAPPPSPGRNRDDAGAPQPQGKRWLGTLATTKRVAFGGGSACPYRIRLEQVRVDVAAAANGDLAAANVSATAIEDRVDPACGNPPIPPNTHTYALAKATLLADGTVHLELKGAPTNSPAVSLVMDGDLHTAFPAMSLAWHRTDQAPPLDWRVNAQIVVSPM